MKVDERDEHGDDHYFVRKRVDEFSKRSNETAAARDVAVDSVSYRRCDKEKSGEQVSYVEAEDKVELRAQREKDHDDRHEEDPRDAQDIRQVKRLQFSQSFHSRKKIQCAQTILSRTQKK